MEDITQGKIDITQEDADKLNDLLERMLESQRQSSKRLKELAEVLGQAITEHKNEHEKCVSNLFHSSKDKSLTSDVDFKIEDNDDNRCCKFQKGSEWYWADMADLDNLFMAPPRCLGGNLEVEIFKCNEEGEVTDWHAVFHKTGYEEEYDDWDEFLVKCIKDFLEI